MSPNPEPIDYAAALEQLENILARIESGEIKLEDMINSISKAKELIAYCQAKLREAEQLFDDTKVPPQ